MILVTADTIVLTYEHKERLLVLAKVLSRGNIAAAEDGEWYTDLMGKVLDAGDFYPASDLADHILAEEKRGN